jgi:hypothetical protein
MLKKKLFMTLSVLGSLVCLGLFQNFTQDQERVKVIDLDPEDQIEDEEGIINRLHKKFAPTMNQRYYTIANRNKLTKINYTVHGQIFLKRYKKDVHGYPMAEMHLSVEPPMNKGQLVQNENHPRLVHHTIGGTLIELIDNVPGGSYIRVAVFILKNPEIKKAMVRAIERGVVVRVLTTTEGEETISFLNKAFFSQDAVAEKDIHSNPIFNYNESWVRLCPHKGKDKTNPGGCLSDHLMHHKFVTFSTICRFGLDVRNECHNKIKNDEKLNSYKNVVLQGSWNFGATKKHEMASIFFGFEELYDIYTHHFKEMRVAAEAEQPKKIISKPKYVYFKNNSTLEINFMPIPFGKDISSTNLFVNRIKDLKCSRGKNKTIVRIANTHWGRSSDAPVATVIINSIKNLVSSGCDVRVLLPMDMKLRKEKFEDMDSLIFKDLIKTNAQIKSFAYADNSELVGNDSETSPNMHSKYALVEDPSNSKNNILMFGTMSFTTTSQSRNDESWLVWRNPSQIGFESYKGAFDRLWNSIN